MDVFEAIFTRRSIRKYTGEPVSEEDINTILRAGSYAPSANNCQPWQFVVIRDPATLQAIPRLQPYTKMAPQAGCAILVCGDKERQRRPGFVLEDCSAAIENILLAAKALGLGTVWCGMHPITRAAKGMTELLGLPKTIIPVGLVVLGHPAEDRQVGERFDPARVHYERW
jgi:nitroreductase